MNNLHRELAPISDKAWAQIEEEASRTLKRHLAARETRTKRGLQQTAESFGRRPRLPVTPGAVIHRHA
jgi:uncharacterized linocin/CFP29 family protein